MTSNFDDNIIKDLAPHLSKKGRTLLALCAEDIKQGIDLQNSARITKAWENYRKNSSIEDRDLPLIFLNETSFAVRHFLEQKLNIPSSDGVPEAVLKQLSKNRVLHLLNNLQLPITQEHLTFLGNPPLAQKPLEYHCLVSKLLHEKSFDMLDTLLDEEGIHLDRKEGGMRTYFRLKSSYGLINITLNRVSLPEMPLYAGALRFMRSDILDYLLTRVDLDTIIATDKELCSVSSLWGGHFSNDETREEEERQRHLTRSLLENTYLTQGISQREGAELPVPAKSKIM